MAKLNTNMQKAAFAAAQLGAQIAKIEQGYAGSIPPSITRLHRLFTNMNGYLLESIKHRNAARERSQTMASKPKVT